MDGERFDELVKRWGAGSSRRGLLKTIMGAGIGGALAAAGVGDAAAARRCRSLGNVCSRNGDCCSAACAPASTTGRRLCACGDGLKPCNGGCISSDACCTNADCAALAGPCVQGVCDRSTSACVAQPLAVGHACDDGNPCTVNAACDRQRHCSGTPKSCPPGDACNDERCDPSTGQCVTQMKTNGTACTLDGVDSCVTPSSCQAGICTAGSPVCQGKCGTITDACGRAIDCGGCPTGQVCGGGAANICGACVADCAGKCGGVSDGCGGSCVSDCGASIGENKRCDNGVCVACVSGNQQCGGTHGECCFGLFCERGVCISQCGSDCAGKCAGEDNGCGGTCGNPCAQSQTCCKGQCCSAGQTCCGGACCEANQTCCGGDTCCPVGQTCCGGTCATCPVGGSCIGATCGCDTSPDTYRVNCSGTCVTCPSTPDSCVHACSQLPSGAPYCFCE